MFKFEKFDKDINGVIDIDEASGTRQAALIPLSRRSYRLFTPGPPNLAAPSLPRAYCPASPLSSTTSVTLTSRTLCRLRSWTRCSLTSA